MPDPLALFVNVLLLVLVVALLYAAFWLVVRLLTAIGVPLPGWLTTVVQILWLLLLVAYLLAMLTGAAPYFWTRR